MKELSNRQKQAMETRSRIQDASFRLFNRDGFENVTMESIAQEAGCSVGNIYHYFPNKDALTVVMTDQVDRQYTELELRYDSSGMSAAEKLIDFSGEALLIDSREDLLYQCLIYSIKDPVQSIMKPDEDKLYFRLLRKLVDGMIRECRVRSRFTAEDVMNSFIVMNRGILLEWRIEEGGFDIRTRGRMMAEALIRGLCE